MKASYDEKTALQLSMVELTQPLEHLQPCLTPDIERSTKEIPISILAIDGFLFYIFDRFRFDFQHCARHVLTGHSISELHGICMTQYVLQVLTFL